VRATGPSSAVRQSVHERDGDRCVHCGTFDSLQVHHRRARAMGGTVRSDTNSPANLVLLCLSCHARVESQRDWARDRGLLLRQSQTPAEVPLVWHGCHVRLHDDGTVQHEGDPSYAELWARLLLAQSLISHRRSPDGLADADTEQVLAALAGRWDAA
jgi:5-methylcytosine-specific restriction protein A